MPQLKGYSQTSQLKGYSQTQEVQCKQRSKEQTEGNQDDEAVEQKATATENVTLSHTLKKLAKIDKSIMKSLVTDKSIMKSLVTLVIGTEEQETVLDKIRLH